MMLRLLFVACSLVSLLLLNACGSRSDDTGIIVELGPNNEFLLFPNSHASIGVGDYNIVFTNTTFPTNPTAFTVTVIFSDGTSAVFSGTWTANMQTVTQAIEVRRAGGITILLNSGGATATLSLCNVSVPSPVCDAAAPSDVIASAAAALNPSISLARYNVDQAAYAQAYYAAVDPLDERDTLAKFQTKNGFAGCTFEVRFRDVQDLGYGRHFCGWQNVGDVAFFVDNYQVTAVPGQDYGPLNLDAVIAGDGRWHIGVSAIEWSPGPAAGARFAKFYSFNSDGSRRLLVDVDGQGLKAMPGPCVSCHGGRTEPLLATPQIVVPGVTSTFPQIGAAERGDTLSRLQPVNVDSLDFSSTAGFTRVDQEATLKGINQLVLCSYPLVGGAMGAEDACRTAVAGDEWRGTAAEMIKTWYGGNGMPNAAQSDMAYLPAGYAPGAEENVYRTVVAPSCRTCHTLRGYNYQSDIDFLTYAKFTGYADRIKHHVFDRGNMPLALLIYNDFWSGAGPATLAPIIPGATDGSGNPLLSTRPVAKPGPDRVVLPGMTKLSAVESTNASSHRWRVAAGPCVLAPGQESLVRPTLTTAPGACTIELIVSKLTQTSPKAPAVITDSAPVNLTVVVSAAAPSSTTFANIRTILQGGAGCSGCHDAGVFPDIPVYYVDVDRDGDADVDADDLHQFYLDVRARINFSNIEASPLLRKPSGNHHGGGAVFNIAMPPGDPTRVEYDTFLNWILAGAPES